MSVSMLSGRDGWDEKEIQKRDKEKRTERKEAD